MSAAQASRQGFRDRETGTDQNRVRQYSPRLGRYLQRDPLGYAAGSMNLYEYLHSSPQNYTDPLGLAPPASAGGGGGPDQDRLFRPLGGGEGFETYIIDLEEFLEWLASLLALLPEPDNGPPDAGGGFLWMYDLWEGDADPWDLSWFNPPAYVPVDSGSYPLPDVWYGMGRSIWAWFSGVKPEQLTDDVVEEIKDEIARDIHDRTQGTMDSAGGLVGINNAGDWLGATFDRDRRASARWWGDRIIWMADSATWLIGICFTEGTELLTPDGLQAIESITVGQRVLTLEPEPRARSDVSGEDDDQADWDGSTAVDQATWRLVTLSMPSPDASGDVISIRSLRSLPWLRATGARDGAWITLRLPELGLAGRARVESIAPCPQIEDGPGRVVLSTFESRSQCVLRLWLHGLDKPLEATRPHPFYSEDRQRWVAAGELKVGERLRTLSGPVAIDRIELKPGVHRVYNLELEAEHRYIVTELGVVSHNGCLLAITKGAGRALRAAVRNPRGLGGELVAGLGQSLRRGAVPGTKGPNVRPGQAIPVRRRPSGLTPTGRAMTPEEARRYVGRGGDVYTPNPKHGRKMAGRDPVGPEIHPRPGQVSFPHWHPKGRRGGHVFVGPGRYTPRP